MKRRGVGVERADIMSVKPSVEQSMAETLDIEMCLTSIIFECEFITLFNGYFKTFITLNFAPP